MSRLYSVSRPSTHRLPAIPLTLLISSESLVSQACRHALKSSFVAQGCTASLPLSPSLSLSPSLCHSLPLSTSLWRGERGRQRDLVSPLFGRVFYSCRRHVLLGRAQGLSMQGKSDEAESDLMR
jgi:hypothetical protein